MGATYYFGIVTVFLLIIIIGFLSGKNITVRAFSGEKTSNYKFVTGALVGTLVGGSSTIGTAQLAYNYGLSAWWFTLGGGIGVFILGYIYRSKYYHQNTKTIPELIEGEYGKKCSVVILLCNSLGTFLSVVAQMISASALLSSMVTLPNIVIVGIIIFFIIVYVIFGGALSIGYAGTTKTILITLLMVICGGCALIFNDGYRDIIALEPARYFNIIARGLSIDIGAGVSLIIGVLTTQSYISALAMAKNKKELTKSTIITAVWVPFIGLFGIVIGLYMKANYPNIDSKMALPRFILDSMPPFIGGLMLGTLLIAVIGSAAGLTYGIAKMILVAFKKKSGVSEIVLSRILILVILICAGAISLGDTSSFILEWSFMSMGLRGAAAIVPLLTALYLPGKIKKKFVIVAIIVGPIFTLIGNWLLPEQVDSIFLGIIASLLVEFCGMYKVKNK